MTSASPHVVIGAAGATGRRVVAELLRRGHPVRAVTRSGRAFTLDDIPDQPTWLAADATDLDALTGACTGAVTIYHCVMPPLGRWRNEFPAVTETVIAAAAQTGGRLVYADDTWMYGRVSSAMTPDTPARPVSSHGVLRAWLAEKMLNAAAGGRIGLSIVRAGELYGRGVRSMIADNVFAAVVRGRTAHWFGDPDLPVTPTLIDDFARTLVAVGVRDTSPASIWHVPHPAPTTGRSLVRATAELAGTRPRLMAHGQRHLRLAALVSPIARHGAELVYQFEQPFVVDGSLTAQRFGVTATPYREGIHAIVSGATP